jgi:hypothetical protein
MLYFKDCPEHKIWRRATYPVEPYLHGIKEDQCVHVEPNAVEKLMLIPRPFTRGTVDFLPEEEDNWS